MLLYAFRRFTRFRHFTGLCKNPVNFNFYDAPPPPALCMRCSCMPSCAACISEPSANQALAHQALEGVGRRKN